MALDELDPAWESGVTQCNQVQESEGRRAGSTAFSRQILTFPDLSATNPACSRAALLMSWRSGPATTDPLNWQSRIR